MFKRIIPSLLIKNNKLVKGVKFKNHRIVGNPATTAKSLGAQQSDELFAVNLDSYIDNSKQNYRIIKEISNSTMTPLTFGGGVKSVKEAKNVFLNGADKIYLNSNLFNNINLLEDVAKVYGSQSVMAGINIINDLNILEKKNLNALEWIKKLEDSGAGEVKINFVELEGTSSGFNKKICEKLLKAVSIPLIFEGGIGSLNQIKDAFSVGINSIALGTMIYFKDYNIMKIKQFLKNNGYQIR